MAKKAVEIKSSKTKWLMVIPSIIVAGLLYILFSMDSNDVQSKDLDIIDSSVVEAKTDKESPAKNQESSTNKKTFVLEENFKAPELIEKRLKQFPPLWQNMFRENMDLKFVESLEKCKTLEEAVALITAHIDPSFRKTDLTNWLDNCIDELSKLRWKGKSIYELPDEYKLRALASYLIDFQQFKYSEEMTPDLFMVSNVIKKREGYCATLPVVYALISERLDLPVHMVQGASHLFNRYDNGEKKINIETTSSLGMGIGTPDEFYMNDPRTGYISKEFMETTSVMKSMDLRQSISALLINNMAALNDRDSFNHMQSPLPKNGDNLQKSATYMLMALYFDQHSIFPIVNMLNVLKWKPELYSNPAFFDSLRAYGVRKTILPLKKQDIKVINKQMIGVLGVCLDTGQNPTVANSLRSSLS